MLLKSICLSVCLLALNVEATWLGPEYMVKTRDDTIAICFRNSNELRFYDSQYQTQGTIELEGVPTGMTITADQNTVYVTLNDPERVLLIDRAKQEIVKSVAALPGACYPVFDQPRKTLYVCNRWDNSVTAFDSQSLQMKWQSKVRREPGSAALDLKHGVLYVPNRQTVEPANGETVCTVISLLDVQDHGHLIKEIKMPSGFGDYRGMAVSPDGSTVAVVHNLAKFFQGTFQIEWGWMNSSYVTFIDTETQLVDKIIPLDDVIRGAATPWNVAWTEDATTLLVTHAGVHELSVIDIPTIKVRMDNMGIAINFTDQHELMKEGRERVLTGGRSPRAFVQLGTKVVVANFFSDSLGIIDLKNKNALKTISLNPEYSLSLENKGEMYFCDAMLSKQNWQSCIACHPDGRADGLNWDLMNDGLDNLKNTKSLLYAHRTPPAMITGVRPNAEYAVRSGIRAILFTEVNEDQALAIDAYLKAMRPVPSPYLEEGNLSGKAQKGREIFRDPKVGCTLCHHGSLFTDMRLHDVGTATSNDVPHYEWDTPTLIEVWRTAPYLHDGSAPTIREVLIDRNTKQQHGHTDQLSDEELDALAEYLLSL